MNKFKHPKDGNYKAVKSEIQKMVKKAKEVLKKRDTSKDSTLDSQAAPRQRPMNTVARSLDDLY